MTVDPQRDGCGRVSQTFLDNHWVHPLAQQVGGMAVPQVVEPNPGKASPPQGAAQVPLANVVTVQGLSIRLAKDQAVLVSRLISGKTSLTVLSGMMRSRGSTEPCDAVLAPWKRGRRSHSLPMRKP